MDTSSGDQKPERLTSLEICAGAGGQAIGLHGAGFHHLALVEYDRYAHATLEANVTGAKGWEGCEVLHEDLVTEFKPSRPMTALGNRPLEAGELSLLAGGVPCPPFSVAGQQLGQDDERDLFPRMLELADELRPHALMIENVRGIMSDKFDDYRNQVIDKIEEKRYRFCGWHLLEAHNYGVPQLRPRSILIAIRDDDYQRAGIEDGKFPWPVGKKGARQTVFKVLKKSMMRRRDELLKKFPEQKQEIIDAYNRWHEATQKRDNVAPTLVGGSRKHGGADLGPSRAKKAWAELGVNALGVADEAAWSKSPERDFLRAEGPMLTVKQAAILQGFSDKWNFVGGKTAQYRQVGNAFPPTVAEAVGRAIASVLQPDRADDLLSGLKIEHLGADRPGGQRAHIYVQPVFDEVLTASSAPAQSTPPTDLRHDLVSADV